MIKYIGMVQVPRQTGKTTQLLKKFDMYYSKGDEVFIITFSENEAKRLRQQTTLNHQEGIQRIIGANMFSRWIRGHTQFGKDVILLIDEPFLIDKDIQDALIQELERSRIEFYVIGLGTLRENFRRDFTHYVDWRK